MYIDKANLFPSTNAVISKDFLPKTVDVFNRNIVIFNRKPCQDNLWFVFKVTDLTWIKSVKCFVSGGTPLAGIRHAPVKRALFCIDLSPNAPLVHNLTPYDPLFLIFRSKACCKSQKKKIESKIVELPGFCAISHPMTLFLDLPPNDPLCLKKIFIDNPLI